MTLSPSLSCNQIGAARPLEMKNDIRLPTVFISMADAPIGYYTSPSKGKHMTVSTRKKELNRHV